MLLLLKVILLAAPILQPSCDASLIKHVYNPNRLKVLDPCRTITGKVELVRKEHDGDVHTLVKLDSQFKSMLNPSNIKKQKGDLVVEPMCTGKVIQDDTIKSKVCQNFKQSFPSLVVGKCVRVTGAFVLDAEHGHNEIHPVTKVEEIPCSNQ